MLTSFSPVGSLLFQSVVTEAPQEQKAKIIVMIKNGRESMCANSETYNYRSTFHGGMRDYGEAMQVPRGQGTRDLALLNNEAQKSGRQLFA